MSGSDPGRRAFDVDVVVRSYELDSFGHLNHAVYLNYFEFARFDAFTQAGFPPERLLADGVGIHVVRVEVDYLAEGRLGQHMRISTRLEEMRNTSMTAVQVAHDPNDPERRFARARVVVVWIGPNGRPTRIPDVVREAVGPGR